VSPRLGVTRAALSAGVSEAIGNPFGRRSAGR
jgi:hypothetical protein